MIPPPATSPAVRPFDVADLLRLVGAGLVVLAAVFLTATAIDRGWIGPEVQLAIATGIGAALLAGAVVVGDPSRPVGRLATRRRDWARTFGCSGAIVLPVCAGAAFAWLSVVSATASLGLVTAAAVLSVAVAIRIRSELVAVAAVVAMLVVPPFARLLTEAPVLVIGSWLGGFAVAATVAGRRLGWPAFRLVSGWAAALWVLGLAWGLALDGNTDHGLTGTLLVCVVAAALWLGPSPLGASPLGADRVAGDAHRPALVVADLRIPTLLPIWAWLAIGWFFGLSAAGSGWLVGLAIAALSTILTGFAVLVADRTGRGLLPDGAVIAHLMGAGLLVTVSLLAGLGGQTLLVALAIQALITAVLSTRVVDGPLRINGIVLAAIVWALLVDDLVVVLGIAADVGDVGTGWVDHLARGLVAGVLVGIAAAVDRLRGTTTVGHPVRVVADVINGAVFLTTAGFVLSLVAPWIVDRAWLAAGAAIGGLALVLGARLGRTVSAIGAATLSATVIGTVVALLDTVAAGPNGWPGIAGHLSTLAVVVVLGLLVVAIRRVPDWLPSPIDPGPPLFVLGWLLGLGWFASVLIAVPQGQAAISAAWAAAAVAAVIVGLSVRDPLAGTIRSTGLATIAAVVVKLVTVDLAEVDTLARVGLFLAVGLGLLRLAYVLADEDDDPSGQGRGDAPAPAAEAGGRGSG